MAAQQYLFGTTGAGWHETEFGQKPTKRLPLPPVAVSLYRSFNL